VNTRHEEELFNPVAALDGLPRWRRMLVGLAAVVSGLFAGLAGVVVLYGTLIARKAASPWFSSALGGSLLIVALYLCLVWLRLWFGPREWLDRAVNRLFLRSYVYLIWAIVLLLVFVAIKLLAKQ
jgi:hypothetical protein